VTDHHQTIGTSIRIFLVDGDPDGFRIVEKSNWSGQALVVSRSQYPEVRARKEFDSPGVYALLAPAGEDDAKPRIYVGEADTLRPRLDHHLKTKDFWTRLIAFSSKDLNLNKAHIRYLESRLVGLANQAKTWTVENGNVPQPSNLSEPDIAEAEGFLREMLVIYPVLGVDAFDVPRKKVTGELTYKIEGPDTAGEGREEHDGFVVLEGALGRIEEMASYHKSLSAMRSSLLDEGVLLAIDGRLRLTQDYKFSSPSTAAAVLLGRNANGRIEWKTEAGKTLKEIQEKAVE
jgi:hypothetical protein